MEKVMETRTCKHCGVPFDITDRDLEFYNKISPVFAGKKYQISPPTRCPGCRHQRRLAFRNERSLYHRKCDFSGKNFISSFSPDKPYKVYEQNIRWSEQWNPLEYGRDFDFSKTFTEQYHQLLLDVPRMWLSTMNNENCDYVNQIRYCKDCYLCFDNGFNEYCMYAGQTYHSKYVVDSFRVEKGENLYECCNVRESYKLFYSQNCTNCNSSYFLQDCINCTNCFGCVNLVGKDYHIFNKPYSREEYEQQLTEYALTDYQTVQDLKRQVATFALTYPHKYVITLNCENSDGDYLSGCKDNHYSFSVNNSEDMKYVYDIDDACTSCMDVSCGSEGNLMYEGMSISWYKLLFNRLVGRAENIFYGDCCFNGRDCFACSWLHANEQYCIFNKQYTKAEYEELVPKIIEHMIQTGEWGEFFDPQISTVWYNESVAHEAFPLNKEEALKQGFVRSDYEKPLPQIDNAIKPGNLPSITEIDANGIHAATGINILQQPILCERTGKAFKVIKQELDFYRKYNLPLPHRCPEQRYQERMTLRNPRHLRDRTCAKCWIAIKTSYSPDRPEIVYCEACYNKEIYW